MKTRWIVGFIVCCFLLVAGGAVAVGLYVRNQIQGASEAELAEERDRERREAAMAFQALTPPSESDVAIFRPLLQTLGQDLIAGNAGAVTQHFDADRMAGECIRQGAFEKLGIEAFRPGARRDFATGIQANLGRSLVSNAFIKWDETRLRRLRWSSDSSEAVVIARHRFPKTQEEEGVEWLTVRWWFVSTPTGWKIYDFEDLDQGSRISALMVSTISPNLMKNPGQLRTAATAVQQAMQQVRAGDVDAADRTLTPVRLISEPPFLIAMRDLIEATIACQRGEGAKALAFLDSVERAQPDMPIVWMFRTFAYNIEGRYEDAIAAGKKYTEQLGPVAIVQMHMGAAYEELGRRDEAMTAYRAALDDSPDDTESLTRLASLLPKGSLKELAARLNQCTKPEELFEQFVRAAYAVDDLEAVEALVQSFRKRCPNDQRGLEQTANLAFRRDRHADAVVVLKEAFARTGNDRQKVIENLTSTFASYGQAVAAYEAAPAADRAIVFRTAILTLTIDDDDDDYEPLDDPEIRKHREKFETMLTQFLARRARDAGNDPWSAFARGTLARKSNQWALAEREFEVTVTALPAADPDRSRVVYSQVLAIYKQHRGLVALAKYQNDTDVFRQLAGYYTGDSDAAGFEQLLNAYDATKPKDADLPYWRGTLAWLKKDYPVAAGEFRRYLDRHHDDKEYGYDWMAQDRLVRSLIRAGQVDDAFKYVSTLKEVDGYSQYRILKPLVIAARGDTTALRELVSNASKTSPWYVSQLYRDEDIGPMLAKPAFVEFRKAYPEPAPFPRSGK